MTPAEVPPSATITIEYVPDSPYFWKGL